MQTSTISRTEAKAISSSPLQIQNCDLNDARLAAQLPGDLVGDRLVAFQHHDGVAACRRAVQLHRCDVDAVLAQAGGDGGHMAGRVLVVDDQRVVVAAEIRRDAVDLADVDAPAADGCAHDLQLAPRRAGQAQHGGVGVRTAQINRTNVKMQPGLLGDGKAVRDAVVVGLHRQQPGHQRPVGAVAAPRGGKAAVEQDLGLGGLLAQQAAPAVWLLEGPVITGPSTSNNRIADTSLLKWYEKSITNSCRQCKFQQETQKNVRNFVKYTEK